MKERTLITHLRAAIAERDIAIADLLLPRPELSADDLVVVTEAMRLYATIEPKAKDLLPRLEQVWAGAAVREAHREQWTALIDGTAGAVS